jgi:hypothetical protein
LSGDLGAPIDLEYHHLVVSDLLQQLEGQADPFLDEVLQRHGVRGLRLVGPLSPAGKRFSLAGEELGRIVEAGGVGSGSWLWDLLMPAYPEPTLYSRRARGPATSRNEADRAMCFALRALGWAPVEVPPETLEHIVELPPGFVEEGPPAERQACTACDGRGEYDDYGGPWDCPRCGGSGEVPVDEPAEDALHYSAEDVERTGERIAAAQRAYNEWQTRIANLNRRLSYGARASRPPQGVLIEWRGDEGEVSLTLPPHLLLAVGREAVSSRFALWVEFVRGERDDVELGEEPAWVEGCELEITHRREQVPSGRRGIDFTPLNRAISQLRPSAQRPVARERQGDLEFEASGQPRTVTFSLGEDDRL